MTCAFVVVMDTVLYHANPESVLYCTSYEVPAEFPFADQDRLMVETSVSVIALLAGALASVYRLDVLDARDSPDVLNAVTYLA